MKKILGVLICVTALGFFAGCGKDNPFSSEDYDMYVYAGYNSSGTQIAKGVLLLSKDRTYGHWELEAAGDQQDGGVWPGSGPLAGTPGDTSLTVELYPDVCDASYRLTGKIEDGIYSGTWAQYGFAGLMNQGTFTSKQFLLFDK